MQKIGFVLITFDVHSTVRVLCYYLVTLKIIKGIIVIKYHLIERGSKIIISTMLLKHKQAMVVKQQHITLY